MSAYLLFLGASISSVDVAGSDFKEPTEASRTIPFTIFLGENKRFFFPDGEDNTDDILSTVDDV